MSDTVELRILTGCHSGARAPVAGGERLGPDGDCDLVITDLGGGIEAWLLLKEHGWALAGQPQPGSPLLVPETNWGEVAYLGEQVITVSGHQAPWQGAPARRAASPAVAAAVAASETEIDVVDDRATQSPSEGVPPAAQAVPASQGPRVVVVIGLAVIALLLSVLWSVLTGRTAPAVAANGTVESAPSEATPMQLAQAQLAIAGVDPALRLHVEATSMGRVRVAGWVNDVDQLDRLAEALAKLRPVPEMAVRTASDLLDDLAGAAGADAAELRFRLLGAGRVQVAGLVMIPGQRDQILARLRERVPHGVDVVDGLTIAQNQGPSITQWLKGAGFAAASAQWVEGQMQIALSITPPERPRLEGLLARAGTPLSGIPFVLQAKEVARPLAAVAAPVLVHASQAPLPFRIQGVVGGAAPYVVLDDGSKLQPGGRRKGWRLVAVESDRLVFDGPRQLVVRR